MTLCLRRGFTSQGGFVSNELSQVPVHVGEDLCHQIQHYYTLNIPFHIYFVKIRWMRIREKMLNKHISLHNMQHDNFTRRIKNIFAMRLTNTLILTLLLICKHKIKTKKRTYHHLPLSHRIIQ